MTQLVFDERLAAQLEAFYRRREVRARRALVLEALAPEPGGAILDVGCGPGFYAADLLDKGATVTGVDPSPAMLAIARKRAPATHLLEGTATQLPVEDAAFDRALAVQVFEYVADVDGGLAELRRVLRPGGRLVIWDIDWSTLSWYSRDSERMTRMLAAWDRHLANPVLPRTLAAALRRAGFDRVQRHAHVFETSAMEPETFGGNLPAIIHAYSAGSKTSIRRTQPLGLTSCASATRAASTRSHSRSSASPPRADTTHFRGATTRAPSTRRCRSPDYATAAPYRARNTPKTP